MQAFDCKLPDSSDGRNIILNSIAVDYSLKPLSSIFGFFCFFCLVFDVRIPGTPSGIGFSFYFLFVGVFFVLGFRAVYLRFKSVCRYFYCFAVLNYAILCFLLFRVIFNAEGWSVLLACLKAITLFLSLIFYIAITKASKDTIYKRLYFSFLINAIVCLVAGTNPDLLEIVRYFQNEQLTDGSLIPFRNAFLSSSGYFSVGTAYGLAFLILSFKFNDFFKSSYIVYLFGMFVIALASILAARTSFVSIAIGFLIIAYNGKDKLYYIPILFVVFAFFFLNFDDLNIYSDWIFELIYNDGSVNSLDGLVHNMYFLPSAQTLLFGDGFHSSVDGLFYGGTDAGYMRNILLGGLVYVFLIFLFPICWFVKLRQVSFFFAVASVVVMSLFHFKGSFYFNNAQGMAVFYFSYYILALRSKNRSIDI